MPVYVYRNLNTGETFEVEQRMVEDALTEHPETGDPVKRIIQPVGIAFKGSGFYVTDSKSDGSKKTTPEPGTEAKKDSTETKSDAKSESKSEPKASAPEKPKAKPKSEPKT